MLERYITERPALIEESGLPKDDFKKQAFAIFYYPSRKEILFSNPIFKKLHAEISQGSRALLDLYPSYLEHARERKGRWTLSASDASAASASGCNAIGGATHYMYSNTSEVYLDIVGLATCTCTR
eukprot:COSAG02_NODE_2847_length_7905_cov_3.444017_9_plen_125_part_00